MRPSHSAGGFGWEEEVGAADRVMSALSASIQGMLRVVGFVIALRCVLLWTR